MQGFRISPYLQELLVVAGVTEVYAAGNALLEQLLRIPVSASSVYRVTVATAENLEEEALYEPVSTPTVYAQVDGSMLLTDAGWQEVKVGRLFSRDALTGAAHLEESHYCAYLGSYPAFCERFEKLLPASKDIVFISDGAEWIKNWVERSYPTALQILDYYHAVENLAQTVQGLLLPLGWLDNQRKLLLESKLDEVMENVKSLKHLCPQKQEKLFNYYEKNRYRMDYQAYRQKGFCIGSGAIEATHRTLIQQRMKRSGQRWSSDRAQQLLKLRVAFKNQRQNLITQTINRAA